MGGKNPGLNPGPKTCPCGKRKPSLCPEVSRDTALQPCSALTGCHKTPLPSYGHGGAQQPPAVSITLQAARIGTHTPWIPRQPRKYLPSGALACRNLPKSQGTVPLTVAHLQGAYCSQHLAVQEECGTRQHSATLETTSPATHPAMSSCH